MAHGAPDFSNDSTATTVKVLDTGEVAARLGSVDILDRSGTVIYLDDGNHGIEDYYTVVVANVVKRAKLRRGSISGVVAEVNLTPAYGSSNDFELDIPFSKLGKIGIEYKIYLDIVSGGTLPMIGTEVDIMMGNKIHQFFMYFEYATQKINAIEMTGGIPSNHYISTPTDGFGAILNSGYFIHIKEVLDPSNNRWAYVTLNGRYIDLSSIPVEKDTLVTPNRIAFIFNHATATGGINTGFSDLIITNDEPDRKE